jgi:virginiamycin B lyase
MRSRQWRAVIALAIVAVIAATGTTAIGQGPATTTYFPVAPGAHPHDVAAAPEAGGVVYYTAQATGRLGILDPNSGRSVEVALGERSAPHGVVVGPDGAAWITDGGQNAIVRVDPKTHAVKRWPLPASAAHANLNTPTFDRRGRLWFTGQSGYYGRLDPASGRVDVWRAPRGTGPYGMTTTPGGDVYYASLAGNHIARIDVETGEATVIEPPTRGQGARRVWSDSKGNVWMSDWNTGQVARYDPAAGSWREWTLPGKAHVYAVWVDPDDKVWLSDWSANAIVRFDPVSGAFTRFVSDQDRANVRQLQGRAGETWGAESGNDRIVRIATRCVPSPARPSLHEARGPPRAFPVSTAGPRAAIPADTSSPSGSTRCRGSRTVPAAARAPTSPVRRRPASDSRSRRNPDRNSRTPGSCTSSRARKAARRSRCCRIRARHGTARRGSRGRHGNRGRRESRGRRGSRGRHGSRGHRRGIRRHGHRHGRHRRVPRRRSRRGPPRPRMPPRSLSSSS